MNLNKKARLLERKDQSCPQIRLLKKGKKELNLEGEAVQKRKNIDYPPVDKAKCFKNTMFRGVCLLKEITKKKFLGFLELHTLQIDVISLSYLLFTV